MMISRRGPLFLAGALLCACSSEPGGTIGERALAVGPPAGHGPPTSAASVTYSNATSGLPATNVQDAIDELAQMSSSEQAQISSLQSQASMVATQVSGLQS